MLNFLDELRKDIDNIDNQLLELLTNRMGLVKKIGDLKKKHNAIIYRPEREKSILDRLEAISQKGSNLLNRAMIDAIFMEIFAASRNFELPERVGYLGPEGSFTHQAAESRFGIMSDYLPLGSIRAVFEAVNTERIRYGVVPIENNQEGFVMDSVDLLKETDLKIAAEILLPIHHAFASQTDKLDHIRRIYSKDIAFLQCSNFLDSYFKDNSLLELIPVESTSKAAHLASQQIESAAICSNVAAKLYRIPILFENIEDSPNNKTRFFIITKSFDSVKSSMNKTTIIVHLNDKIGSLADFLTDFSLNGINLIKLISRPAKERDTFNCWFYIDLDGHHEDENVKKVLEKHYDKIKILGSYIRLC